MSAAQNHRLNLKNPPKTATEYLATLARVRPAVPLTREVATSRRPLTFWEKPDATLLPSYSKSVRWAVSSVVETQPTEIKTPS